MRQRPFRDASEEAGGGKHADAVTNVMKLMHDGHLLVLVECGPQCFEQSPMDLLHYQIDGVVFSVRGIKTRCRYGW